MTNVLPKTNLKENLIPIKDDYISCQPLVPAATLGVRLGHVSDLAKSRSRDIVCLDIGFALTFGRRFSSNATETPDKFQRDMKHINTDLVIARFHEMLCKGMLRLSGIRQRCNSIPLPGLTAWNHSPRYGDTRRKHAIWKVEVFVAAKVSCANDSWKYYIN